MKISKMNRQIYKRLVAWNRKKNKKPLILKGARQVGKTFILKEFGRKLFQKVHYLNFEEDPLLNTIFQKDLKPKRIIQEISFHLDSPIHTGQDILILDEIQYCPQALTSLKYFNETMPGFAICAAGSLLGIRLTPHSFPVGKVEYLEMFPMCFKEFLLACDEKPALNYLDTIDYTSPLPDIIHTKLWDLFKIYLIVGGMPEAVNTYVANKKDLYTACQKVRKIQKDLIQTFLADIAKHSGKTNSMHIERILTNIPSQLAREQDGSASKFKFKGVVPGIRSYPRLAGAFDWLISAGLVQKIHITIKANLPFSAFIKENRFKLFMFDVGLMGAIADIPAKAILEYNFGTYKGYVAESFVAQELICNGLGPLF
jgi:predicted AAA+ superfamily ATPase